MTTVRPFRIHHKGVTYKGNRRVQKHPSFGLFRWYQVVDSKSGALYSALLISALRNRIENDIRTAPFDGDAKESYKISTYHGD